MYKFFYKFSFSTTLIILLLIIIVTIPIIIILLLPCNPMSPWKTRACPEAVFSNKKIKKQDPKLFDGTNDMI